MPSRSTFGVTDKALDGKLAIELRRMRRVEFLTFDEMVQSFAGRGIEVSRETLRRWCHDLGIEAKKVVA